MNEHGKHMSDAIPEIRILIVVDGHILHFGHDDFGLGTLLAVLRETPPPDDGAAYSYASLAIETATREQTVDLAVDHPGLRFDTIDLDQFDQIWCFGYQPGQRGDRGETDVDITDDNIGYPDDMINTDESGRLTPAEVDALRSWMCKGGGVFATGDHHILGATMGSQIPRVRVMRRWTNRDGVPPRNGPIQEPGGPYRYRHVTHQPKPGDPPLAEIPDDAESDDIPQRIEVRDLGTVAGTPRPHPLLGSPFGTIDVLADHMHEGAVHEDHDIAARDDEFPRASDGSHPMPRVVAWARPLPEPPFDHEGPASPIVRFPVIGAYDGHRANIGRVVVDSSFHHWTDLNINPIRNAANQGESRDNWEKIKSYFRNVAVWLARPEQQLELLLAATSKHVRSDRLPWTRGHGIRHAVAPTVHESMLLDWITPFVPSHPGFPAATSHRALIEDTVLGGLVGNGSENPDVESAHTRATTALDELARALKSKSSS